MLGGGGAGQNKDAGSDDGSDAEEDELPRTEGLNEAFFVLGLVLEVVDLFGSEEGREKGHG